MENKSNSSLWAFWALRVGFTVAPILFGLDKFFNFMTDWTMYLSPLASGILPVSPEVAMRVIGIVEIVAGLLVALKPRIGSIIVAVWLVGIIANLLTIPGFLDVALRDLGLAIGAVALFFLSADYACCSASK